MEQKLPRGAGAKGSCLVATDWNRATARRLQMILRRKYSLAAKETRSRVMAVLVSGAGQEEVFSGGVGCDRDAPG